MSLHRQLFFDKQVHDPRWKNAMSGQNESFVMGILDTLGYRLDIDYQRQYPFANHFVADFAFVPEQVVLEVDGKDHLTKAQRAKDKRRDNFFVEAGWEVIRVNDTNLSTERLSFYKHLIQQVVEERRAMYNKGDIYQHDHLTYTDS